MIRIDPEGGACVLLEAKQPGEETLRQIDLELLFQQELGDQPGPYERLLGDALAGDPGHFAREDMVEETWRIVAAADRRAAPRRALQAGRLGARGAPST